MKDKIKDYTKQALFGYCENRCAPNFCIAIVLLRVMATCLITNTHYNNVYPSQIFAIGGLLGDVIFFAVSGYCFAGGIKKDFSRWYAKRWNRIYPPVLIMSILFLLFGYWKIPSISLASICSYFILPTNFLFFGAIMICYVPMYFTVKNARGSKYKWVWLCWLILYILSYLFFIDKSQYLMNAVSHPIVLFLYFGAALIGMAVKRMKNDKKYLIYLRFFFLFIFTAIYFGSNILIRANNDLYVFQFIIPLSLLCMCYFLLASVVSLENNLKKIPNFVFKPLGYIANLTLEIYVVQLIIIKCMETIVFPLNWVLITFSIIVAATILKLITYGISKKLDSWMISE